MLIQIASPLGGFPVFSSKTYDPVYNIKLHHKFEKDANACYLHIRLATIDSSSEDIDCRMIGFVVLPIYQDIDTDEGATKYSKVQISLYRIFT